MPPGLVCQKSILYNRYSLNHLHARYALPQLPGARCAAALCGGGIRVFRARANLLQTKGVNKTTYC